MNYEVNAYLSGELSITEAEEYMAAGGSNVTFTAKMGSTDTKVTWEIEPVSGGETPSPAQFTNEEKISIGSNYKAGKYEIKATLDSLEATTELYVVEPKDLTGGVQGVYNVTSTEFGTGNASADWSKGGKRW